MEKFDWTKDNSADKFTYDVKLVGDWYWTYDEDGNEEHLLPIYVGGHPYFYDSQKGSHTDIDVVYYELDSTAKAKYTLESYEALTNHGETYKFNGNVLIDILRMINKRARLDGMKYDNDNDFSSSWKEKEFRYHCLSDDEIRDAFKFYSIPVYYNKDEKAYKRVNPGEKYRIIGEHVFSNAFFFLTPFTKGDYWMYHGENPYRWNYNYHYLYDVTYPLGYGEPKVKFRRQIFRGEYILKIVEDLNNAIDCTSIFLSPDTAVSDEYNAEIRLYDAKTAILTQQNIILSDSQTLHSNESKLMHHESGIQTASDMALNDVGSSRAELTERLRTSRLITLNGSGVTLPIAHSGIFKLSDTARMSLISEVLLQIADDGIIFKNGSLNLSADLLDVLNTVGAFKFADNHKIINLGSAHLYGANSFAFDSRSILAKDIVAKLKSKIKIAIQGTASVRKPKAGIAAASESNSFISKSESIVRKVITASGSSSSSFASASSPVTRKPKGVTASTDTLPFVTRSNVLPRIPQGFNTICNVLSFATSTDIYQIEPKCLKISANVLKFSTSESVAGKTPASVIVADATMDITKEANAEIIKSSLMESSVAVGVTSSAILSIDYGAEYILASEHDEKLASDIDNINVISVEKR